MIRKILTKIYSSVHITVNPNGYARSLGVQLGDDCRLINIRAGSGTFGSEPYLVKIGNHVTIAGGVQFITHDGGVWIFRQTDPDVDVFGSIVVGDNVFIGYGAVLMPGVRVGNNVVIGAMSVVTKDIDDNSIVAGVPARVIKSSEDYYNDIKAKKENIRSMPMEDKREYLTEKYLGL